ncbi:RICIN domain-containing protein [Streptomyces sp. NPDC014861]|uniref:RICIN domain-containing protein n=1 Tax=Streptomyces sp. NPDC014861 TaxID=3364923 RepID=UPI00370247B7
MAIVATVLVPAQPAAAADLVERAGSWTLTRVDGDKRHLIASVEAAGVQKASITEVLGENDGIAGLCHGTGLNGTLRYDGYCWGSELDHSNYADPAGGWMPQGFAGAHAATDSGLYQGQSSLNVSSWYFGTWVDKRNPTTIEEYTRVTLSQAFNNAVSYGNIALVEPVNGNFKELKYLSHADGVAWYEDMLFVANGMELQVYDLRHIWRMTDTASSGTGLSGGKSSARHHRWALPLVARYTTKANAQIDTDPQPFGAGGHRACGPHLGPLCLSTVSVDRYSHTMVSAENYGKAGGRVVRWDLPSLAFAPPSVKLTSTGAWMESSVWGIQGIALDGATGNYFMSGVCPAGYPMGEKGENKYSCLHMAKAGDAPRVLSQAPQLTQGLSWDWRAQRLWGLNEGLDDKGWGAQRVVFSLEAYAGRADAQGYGWLVNPWRPGFICATPQGDKADNGTPVTIWACSGSESQRWKLENGLIVHKTSGKCLTPQGNGANVNGALLTLWTCNPASDVQKFSQVGGQIINGYGKVITPKGNSLDSGVWLTLWTKDTAVTENVYQKWHVRDF